MQDQDELELAALIDFGRRRVAPVATMMEAAGVDPTEMLRSYERILTAAAERAGFTY